MSWTARTLVAMPDIPFFWLLVVGGLVISTIVRGVRRVQARVAREQWATAAERLGFSLSGTDLKTLKLTGTEGKIRVMVDLKKSDNSTTTRYRVKLPALGFDLGVSRQSDWHRCQWHDFDSQRIDGNLCSARFE